MFIKTTENNWINLNTCRKVEIWERSEGNWSIIFRPTIVGPDNEFADTIESFETELEALEVLDDIWDAYRQGQHFWEPEPREILNVRMENRWIAEDRAIDTYIRVIGYLGIERVKALELTVNTIPLIANYRDPHRAQRQMAGQYIVSGTNTITKKKILEDIASQLEVEMTVTANPRV